MAIPQVSTVIPNPMGIILPDSSTSSANTSSTNSLSLSASLTFSQADYPGVLNWHRPDSNADDNDLTRISDDDDDEDNSKLAFIVHKDGVPFTLAEQTAVRDRARAAFQTLIDRKIVLAKWSNASSTATDSFRSDMLKEFPQLGFCSNNWKLHKLAMCVYSQWVKRRRVQIQEKVKDTNKKRKERMVVEEDDGDEPSAPIKPGVRKRRPADDGRDAAPMSKRLKTNTLKDLPESHSSGPTSTHPNSHSPFSSDTHASDSTHIPAAPPRSSPSSSSAPATTTQEIVSPSEIEPTMSNAAELTHQSSPSITDADMIQDVPEKPAVKARIPNPLTGIFGKKKPTGPRLTDTETDPSLPSATDSTAPLAGASLAKTPKKLKAYVPGKKDNAWNLFAREHMADHKDHTRDQVEDMFKKLTSQQKRKYDAKEARMKQLKKEAAKQKRKDAKGKGKAKAVEGENSKGDGQTTRDAANVVGQSLGDVNEGFRHRLGDEDPLSAPDIERSDTVLLVCSRSIESSGSPIHPHIWICALIFPEIKAVLEHPVSMHPSIQVRHLQSRKISRCPRYSERILHRNFVVRSSSHRNIADMFCFIGGLIITGVQLPGINNVFGLWLAVWTMGNHGCVGYGVWPYVYEVRDVGTVTNQMLNSGPPAALTSGAAGELSYLPVQRLSHLIRPLPTLGIPSSNTARTYGKTGELVRGLGTD
ncbi:beta-glucan synthesis-associated protein-domain-containing protein [Mycena maculata]|uniref:Beta-glucan synthesis-associated protein-domain-containing protein n=1 Tax=Mycena maculata TaxID=230809 RepID=A0AAD7K6E1_9AGAR|nr:beta-glucan synthesis-associated protein-domain-containing protein [Mycena maculata]